MTTFKRFIALATTSLIAAGSVYAVDQSVSVAAQFRQALSLTKNADIDFTTGSNVIEFTGTPTTGDVITLGTDGNMAETGTAFTVPATGTPADIDITGDGASAVDISCSTGAVLKSGSNTVTINEIVLDMNTGAAYASAAYTCAGVGTTPHSHTLDGTDTILLGAQLDAGEAGTAVVSAVYSTGNAGGSAATVRVVYQ